MDRSAFGNSKFLEMVTAGSSKCFGAAIEVENPETYTPV